MATLEQIYDSLARTEQSINELIYRLQVSGKNVVVVGGLSDIDDNLGLIKAGEFRSGVGIPGDTNKPFTGVRIGAPGWTYGTTRYSIAGLNADVLQFGLSNDDGKIYAGGGSVVLDSEGVTISQGSNNQNKIKWVDGAAIQSMIYGYTSAPEFTLVFSATGASTGGDGNILLTAKPYNVSASSYLLIDPDIGVKVYEVAGGNANIMYDGALISHKGGADYTGYIFVPLVTPLTSTDWTIDAFSTTAKTLLDLSTVFSAPAGIKAILAVVSVRDSGSAGGDYYLILSPNNTASSGMFTRCSGLPNDSWTNSTAIVPCNADGDIYYQIVASGTNTFDVVLQIWGYWI